ncbi:nucleoside triphosphate pyrophosphohydrolase [Candidatus Endobugula sertula]|uniref:Nucleoside triphosphate pyrophosphohydrolase n=1 Tax=Candidatus Endobugula sertula TaxID=62101 RepID=A0A1D2QPD4_9GAMM|nr:nucleoside triphosphate pyrophosphohydrolase [Candidatus Endobugula sertula]
MKQEPYYSIADLLQLMSHLREPEYGCPWDLAQDYQSIAPSTLEEAYEVVDAIEQGDRQQLKEELGDLLFQVVFYSQLGSEEGAFNFADITSEITAKLLRRHPHVFPNGVLESRINHKKNEDTNQESVKASWENIKQTERIQKGHHSVLDDIPKVLPAVVRAAKLQKRASSIGFDWESSEGVYDKLAEELAELKEAQLSNNRSAIEDELGDVLFTVVNLARHLKINPEMALRRANTKFEQRFRCMEKQAQAEHFVFAEEPKAALEVRWELAKRAVKDSI